MKIITDHKWKAFCSCDKVPKKVLHDYFSHVKDDYGFFKYKKNWYHVSDFMRIEKNSPLAGLGFDGYSSDSFFSGVLIKLDHYEESYQVGTYISFYRMIIMKKVIK
jgi:hypothetical protein